MDTQLKLVFALLFGAASVFVLSGSDQLALVGVGAIATVPIAVAFFFCFVAALSGNPRCIQVIGFAAILLISATVRFREYDDKSVDFQILMKIASIALMLTMVAAAWVTKRFTFAWPETLAWSALMGYLVLTSAYSETPAFSAVTSVSLLACGLFCFYLVQTLGTQRAVAVVIFSSAVICLLSIFVFVAFPQLGKMHGWTGTEFGSLNRMRGITPSANAIGSVAALGLLFSYFYGRQMRGPMLYVAIAMFPLAAICLLLSNNRMSMLGVVIAAVCASLFRGHASIKGSLLAVAGLFGLCLLLIFPDQILTSLSRSGDASEITSGTGRSFIWTVVIEHVLARPVFGYGYTSSISVLPKDPRLFGVAAHAHNLYLELLFSGGFIALGLLFTALVVTFRSAIRVHAYREAALLLFFLLKGIMEATPFSGIIAFNAFALFVAIAVIAAQNSMMPTTARARPLPRRRSAPLHPGQAPGLTGPA